MVERLTRASRRRRRAAVSIERTDVGAGARWVDVAPAGERLDVRPFRRPLDSTWRRASYTSLTAFAHEAGTAEVTSEPEEVGIADEQLPVGPVPPASVGGRRRTRQRLRAVPLPLAAMPGGARVGSLVHGVLEQVDFTAADLDGRARRRLAEQLGVEHVDVGPPRSRGRARAAIETPLGPLVGDLRLRDIGPGRPARRAGLRAAARRRRRADRRELDLAALAGVLDAHVGSGRPAGRLRRRGSATRPSASSSAAT